MVVRVPRGYGGMPQVWIGRMEECLTSGVHEMWLAVESPMVARLAVPMSGWFLKNRRTLGMALYIVKSGTVNRLITRVK